MKSLSPEIDSVKRAKPETAALFASRTDRNTATPEGENAGEGGGEHGFAPPVAEDEPRPEQAGEGAARR